MIIDIHTHIFPDELAPRAMETLKAQGGTRAYTDATAAGLRASMRLAGIDVSVIAMIATKPTQVRAINEWAAQISEQFPDLICLGTLHPQLTNWQEEIDWIVKAGLRGIKLHGDYQQFFIDEPSMLPVYRKLAESGLIMLLHAGEDIGWPPPVHCPPDRLAKVLDAVPELTVIAAHMGGYMMWDEVERHLVGRDVYLDTSFSLADMGSEQMASLIKAHGTERILFGTDSPWTDQKAEVAGIRALDLTDDEITAVLGGNTAELLGID